MWGKWECGIASTYLVRRYCLCSRKVDLYDCDTRQMTIEALYVSVSQSPSSKTQHIYCIKWWQTNWWWICTKQQLEDWNEKQKMFAANVVYVTSPVADVNVGRQQSTNWPAAKLRRAKKEKRNHVQNSRRTWRDPRATVAMCAKLTLTAHAAPSGSNCFFCFQLCLVKWLLNKLEVSLKTNHNSP